MPAPDVVVVGAGLAGLTAAVALADGGARVDVLAAGHAASHWMPGGIDVAAPAGAATAREGVRALAALSGHPYTLLGADVAVALGFVRTVLEESGLPYSGQLDDPLRQVPTAIGGTRRVSILPAGQAAALAPWSPNESLMVAGPAEFKDFWPGAIAASLARSSPWGSAEGRPARVEALALDWPTIRGRHNVNALVLARLFDDPSWRAEALAALARAVERRRGQAGRVALPAILGLSDHAGVMADAARIVPAAVFEVPLVPPSLPGMRLYAAMRAALLRRGGRIVVGESIVRVERDGARVSAVVATTASRERRLRTGALVLATGGVAGGGLVVGLDGRVVEPILDLPVEVPAGESLLAADPFDPAGHPVERAGVRVDAELRPLGSDGRPVLDNVAIAGSQLAGQRYLAERCGDGVAIASGWRAAQRLGPARASTSDASVRTGAA
jgi:glycerol-3-phosphate dehydrogenase subunit B